jgi:hypothetical protein
MVVKELEGPGISQQGSTIDSANPMESLEPSEFGEVVLLVLEDPPTTFRLGRLSDARLRVVEPFEVLMSKEGSDFIAEASEINEFGFGESYRAAVTDLQRAITQLFFSLQHDSERLGPDLSATLTTLSEKIIARHP